MSIEQNPILELQGVSRKFGEVEALSRVDLVVAAKQIACLVGQSGCGKSTLLRAIAGVEPIDAGGIRIGGVTVAGADQFIEPEHRQVGLMFQDYALFPHLTARQNIAFGLSKLRREAAAGRVEEIIDLLNIGALANRYPHMLSGGEQQRVALARALAPQPKLLLMDEPFSNLDRGLREDIRGQTLAMLRKLGMTAIIVTHDPEEALAIGDVVVLMRSGRVVEAGAGAALYDEPRTAYAANFFSQMNQVVARRVGDWIESPIGRFPVAAGTGDDAVLYIRPRAIAVGASGIAARVLGRRPLGEIEEWTFTVAGLNHPLLMRTTDRHDMGLGDEVFLAIDPMQVRIFANDAARAKN